MTTDCQCPRSHHEHGTWHAYANDGCRCPDCRTAWARYMRDRTRRNAYAAANHAPLRVHPAGTMRRLQALACVGWSSHDIATAVGTTPVVIRGWQHGTPTWIFRRSALKVAGLYDAVWDQPPPGRYGVKVRRLAARAGWVPPLAWDDDEIDDPAATAAAPFGGGWDLAPCGTASAYRRHLRRREAPDQACIAAERRRNTERAADRGRARGRCA